MSMRGGNSSHHSSTSSSSISVSTTKRASGSSHDGRSDTSRSSISSSAIAPMVLAATSPLNSSADNLPHRKSGAPVLDDSSHGIAGLASRPRRRSGVFFLFVVTLVLLNGWMALPSRLSAAAGGALGKSAPPLLFDVPDHASVPPPVIPTELQRPAAAAVVKPIPLVNENDDHLRTTTTPQRILAQYKAWHSNDALRSESTEQRRERHYAVAYYSCPYQAGNRLHHFMNSWLWAVVTNRTVLHQYLDARTCRYHQSVQRQIWHDPDLCEAANTPAQCAAVLHRAAWIPAYADWAAELVPTSPSSSSTTKGAPVHVSEANITIVDFWSLHGYDHMADWERQRYPRLNNGTATTTTTTVRVDEMTDRLVDFPELINKDVSLRRPIQRRTVLATSAARARAAGLFEEGTEFLYGMLYKDAFRLRHENAERHQTPTAAHTSTAATDGAMVVPYAIAMHSRHRQSADNGANVAKERACFDQILRAAALRDRGAACHVCLMSDRPTTVRKLRRYLRSAYNCTVVTADTAVGAEDGGSGGGERGFRGEHGPHAGASFYRELDLCQHYTDALVGTGGGSSSTALLEEWIAYNRRVAEISNGGGGGRSEISKDGKRGDGNKMADMHKCWLV